MSLKQYAVSDEFSNKMFEIFKSFSIEKLNFVTVGCTATAMTTNLAAISIMELRGVEKVDVNKSIS